MTVVAERVSHYTVPELSPAPSRLARLGEKVRTTRTAIQEHARRFQEQAYASIPQEATIFVASPTPEQRAESEARFWNGIAEKKKLLAARDPRHADIKTALVIGGGANKGVSSGAKLEGLRANNLLEPFDEIYTDSASTANIACILGSDRVGSDMYIKLVQNGFMNKRPHGMRLEMVMNMLRENVDPARIREARPNWFIGVTDEFGQKRHFEAKKLSDNDMFRVIGVSMAAPWAFNRNILYNGELLTDGYLTGLSTEAAIKRGNDHLLVMLNETDEEIAAMKTTAPLQERLALPAAMWGVYSRDVIRTTLNRSKNLQRTLSLLDHHPDLNIAKLTAPHLIDWQTRNVAEIAKARSMARTKIDQVLHHNGLLEGALV